MLAFTLSRRDFRENDQQIGFYTKEQGKIETVARGVKKIISKNTSAFEPFALLVIDLAPGRGFTYVTRAQVVESFLNIRLDLEKNLISAYCLNLVDEFTEPMERDDKIFNLIYELLKKINANAEVDISIAYDFLFQLLCALGFAPPPNKKIDASIIAYAEYHLSRKVPDIANFREKLYNLQK